MIAFQSLPDISVLYALRQIISTPFQNTKYWIGNDNNDKSENPRQPKRAIWYACFIIILINLFIRSDHSSCTTAFNPFARVNFGHSCTRKGSNTVEVPNSNPITTSSPTRILWNSVGDPQTYASSPKSPTVRTLPEEYIHVIHIRQINNFIFKILVLWFLIYGSRHTQTLFVWLIDIRQLGWSEIHRIIEL